MMVKVVSLGLALGLCAGAAQAGPGYGYSDAAYESALRREQARNREALRDIEATHRKYDTLNAPVSRRTDTGGGAAVGPQYPLDRSILSDPGKYMVPKPTRDCELSVYVNACGKRR